MRKDNTLLFKNKVIERRIFILIFIKLSAFLVLISRLINLQAINYRKYSKLSDNNRFKYDIIPAQRGNILDRNYIPPATNQITYQAIFFPSRNINDLQTLMHFAKIMRMEPSESKNFAQSILNQVKRIAKREPVIIKKFLQWKELVKIEFNIEHLPGVQTRTTVTRVYDAAAIACHITGYVATPSKLEINSHDVVNKQLLMHPFFKIGKSGVEKNQDKFLRGQYGLDLNEVDATGKILQSTNYKLPVEGNDVKTTIDLKLQREVAKVFGERSGGAVVIDLKNGNILSLYSTPGYDPNQFLRGINTNDWSKGISNGDALFNKVINGLYPPGSTFKIISALAGLQAGISPNLKVNCTGKFKYGNRIFHCNNLEGHGTVNLNQAIAVSCNCYFYNIAKEVQVNDISNMAYTMGLGQSYNVGIGSESNGIIPTTSWKQKRYNQAWLGGESMNTVIGQGYLLVNPLQLSIMISRLATGQQIRPSLFTSSNAIIPVNENIKYTDTGNIAGKADYNIIHDSQLCAPLTISVDNLEIVRQGIFSLFSKEYGILRGHHHINPKYQIAGKTGTAQVISRNFTKNEIKDVKLEHKAHGLFVGYGPFLSEKYSPRFAVAAVVEHGVQGAHSAALGKAILYKAIDLMYND